MITSIWPYYTSTELSVCPNPENLNASLARFLAVANPIAIIRPDAPLRSLRITHRPMTETLAGAYAPISLQGKLALVTGAT